MQAHLCQILFCVCILLAVSLYCMCSVFVLYFCIVHNLHHTVDNLQPFILSLRSPTNQPGTTQQSAFDIPEIWLVALIIVIYLVVCFNNCNVIHLDVCFIVIYLCLILFYICITFGFYTFSQRSHQPTGNNSAVCIETPEFIFVCR